MSWGMTTATDAQARTLFVVDAHRDDGRRFVVRSDELLTAFLELERETGNSSPPRRSAHQLFPFSEAALKTKLARRLPAHASRCAAPFAALGVRHVPVLATRDEDMHGERIGLCTHLIQGSLGFMERLAKLFQGVLKPTCSHAVHPNIYRDTGQFCLRLLKDFRQLRPGNSRNYRLAGQQISLKLGKAVVDQCQGDWSTAVSPHQGNGGHAASIRALSSAFSVAV